MINSSAADFPGQPDNATEASSVSSSLNSLICSLRYEEYLSGVIFIIIKRHFDQVMRVSRAYREPARCDDYTLKHCLSNYLKFQDLKFHQMTLVSAEIDFDNKLDYVGARRVVMRMHLDLGKKGMWFNYDNYFIFVCVNCFKFTVGKI